MFDIGTMIDTLKRGTAPIEAIKDLTEICLDLAANASADFDPQQTLSFPVENSYTPPGQLKLKVFTNLKPETYTDGKFNVADFRFRFTKEGENLYAILSGDGGWITVSLHGPHSYSSQFMEYCGQALFSTPNFAKDLMDVYVKNNNGICLKNTQSTSNSLDVLLSCGIPEEALTSNQDLWSVLTNAEQNMIPSANKSWYVKDKSGEEWVLKLYDKAVAGNKHKAVFAAAANYYLAAHFNFIAPGKEPAPLESDQYYMVLQKRIPDELKRNMPLEYWISTLAVFHTEAAKILADNDVAILEKTPLQDVDFYREQQGKTGKVIPLDEKKLKESIDYLAQQREQSGQTLIHRDFKADNQFGPFMIDLDNCALGNPGMDLAMLFAQYQVPKQRWEHYLGMYADVNGFKGSRESEIKELQEATTHAGYYVTTKEILGSYGRKMTLPTAANNLRLLHARDKYLSAA